MKLLKKLKDGGKESTVTGYFLIEYKPLFSIVLLRFDGKSREAFHTHAFNCVNWLLRGSLTETFINGEVKKYKPSIFPFIVTREDFHKVDSNSKTSWVLSFRGPWVNEWKEYIPTTKNEYSLTHGRQRIS